MSIEELKEKFWNEWQNTPKVDKLLWIKDNLPHSINSTIRIEDGLHILDCMESMISSLCGKHPGGDFVEAFLSNDLTRTLDTADDVNQLVLRTYMLFIYNKVPYQLRRK
jgi:hypothetical protein